MKKKTTIERKELELSSCLLSVRCTVINISNVHLRKEDQVQLNQDLEPQLPNPAW